MAHTAHPTEATFCWSEGVLVVHSPLSSMRIRWRPSPLAEEILVGQKKWCAFWPEFRLFRPENAPDGRSATWEMDIAAQDIEQKKQALASFRRDIPEELVKCVEPFRSHQWSMLVMLHDQPRSADLAAGNPVLAYCLANSDQFRNTRPDVAGIQALWHSHHKQRAILQWLGFPGTEGMARIFRKILPEATYPSILRRLRNAISEREDVLRLLAHLETINAGTLHWISHPHLIGLASPKLLKELADDPDERYSSRAAYLALESLALLTEAAVRRDVRPLESIDQVRRLSVNARCEYRAELRRREEARVLGIRPAAGDARRREAQLAELHGQPFPAPPVAGTSEIVPLTSGREVLLEGEEMHHCVATYIPSILAGYMYVYRVMGPERATVAIVRERSGTWRRFGLKARSNKKVKPETAALVDAWWKKYRDAARRSPAAGGKARAGRGAEDDRGGRLL